MESLKTLGGGIRAGGYNKVLFKGHPVSSQAYIWRLDE